MSQPAQRRRSRRAGRVSFYGNYPAAATEGVRRGRATHAITWGHSKDHRPDLKQLLYILTVTEILSHRQVEPWVKVRVEIKETEFYHQTQRGRPSTDTR